MLNPAHILEIALLLLVAFLLGAVIGSLVRLLAIRLLPVKAPAATEAAAGPVVVAPPELVAAPVIGEVVKTPTPTAPADIPTPDFTEALLALAGDKPGSLASKIQMPSIAPLPAVAVTKPSAEMQPARVAGETTSGRTVAHPRSAAEPARVILSAGTSAEVIPFPLEKVAVESSEPPVVVVATPLLPVPAVPVAPENESTTPEPTVAVAPPVEVEAAPVAADLPTEAEAEPVAAVDVLDDKPDAPAGVAPAEVPVAGPPVMAAAIVPAEAPSPAEPVAAEAAIIGPDTSPEDDEAAAMRAIEGNWSPRRATSPRPRKIDLPEVSAEAAVMSPPASVPQAAAEPEQAAEPEAPGRPTGIPAPRLGIKDDLTHVIGILPIIETALNNLGLYHFDQVAELSDENAGWIENHLGIAGRIGREHWREQARELALVTSETRRAAGQQ